MHDNTARTISTVAVWLGVTVILTFGVFGMNWANELALIFMLLVVSVICAAAGISTAVIWGQPCPWSASPRHPLPAARPTE